MSQERPAELSQESIKLAEESLRRGEMIRWNTLPVPLDGGGYLLRLITDRERTILRRAWMRGEL